MNIAFLGISFFLGFLSSYLIERGKRNYQQSKLYSEKVFRPLFQDISDVLNHSKYLKRRHRSIPSSGSPSSLRFSRGTSSPENSSELWYSFQFDPIQKALFNRTCQGRERDLKKLLFFRKKRNLKQRIVDFYGSYEQYTLQVKNAGELLENDIKSYLKQKQLRETNELIGCLKNHVLQLHSENP